MILYFCIRMKKLVFATHNAHKLAEVKNMLPDWEILGLPDIGCFEDIPETAQTLKGNARIKADYITEKYGFDCFADDTGLEIFALDGEPGVYSARYAGSPADSEANMQKVLKTLKDKVNRKAQFRTVIALNYKGKSFSFEGICKGTILREKRGDSGFGYDPIFQPDGFEESFAQMSRTTKGNISHRGKAIRKLIAFLENQE